MNGSPTTTDPPSPPQPDAERILIVRPTALGDVARTVPALVTLRRAYPNATIDWLVAKAFAPAVRNHPMLDGVVEFDRKAMARFGFSIRATRAGLELARRLHQAGYDTVYDLQGLFRSGLFTRLTGARRRVGFANAREAGWLGYNVRHRIDTNLHTVDRMLALLRADGLEPVHDMRLYLAEQDRAWLRAFKEQHGIGESGYACLAPTARWGCKCWPIERYGEIARRLIEQCLAGDKIVLIASPDERSRVLPILDILEQAGIPSAEHVIFPETTVGQMMALLSETRLLVCNDSAPLHIAVGFDRPVVAIFGPTDPALVGPYRRESSVIRPDNAEAHAANYRRHMDDPTLIAQVSVDQVWEKVRETLPV
ncbi:MAG: lipopolysaccharide heptosyltransferase I [Phycisphaeraceae bacterium]